LLSNECDSWRRSTAALPKFAYFPFDGGLRACIGQHFAAKEAALLLATLLQHVELELRAGFRMELKPVITLRSRYGLPVRVRKRSARAHE
jgi:cytochrome P450